MNADVLSDSSARSRSLDVALSIALLAWPLLLWAATRHWAPWGDEAHFLDTVRLFGRGLSLDLLRTYPEMSGPLPFVLYAAWGKVGGFDTAWLRLLSPFIAWVTALLVWATLQTIPTRRIERLLALATIVLNPYFVGLSVFVFTDMLALLGMALALLAIARGWPLTIAAGLAIACLSRQYLAFLAPAMLAAGMLA